MHDPLRGEGEAANQPEIDQHLAMMVALQEDIQCRLAEKNVFAKYFNVKHKHLIVFRIFFSSHYILQTKKYSAFVKLL